MKSIHYFLAIILISFLPFISILTTSDLPHTSDGAMHLVRVASYFKEVQNGQFPIRWAGELNYGYGTPIFNFFHPLPYVLSMPFVFAGLGLVATLKTLFVLSFLLSGIFMFLFTREFFRDEKIAFMAAVFYQFAPFRLVEILVRGSLGGIFSYSFLPLVLLGIVLFVKSGRYRDFLLISFATALLALSHNIVGFLFLIVSFLFVLFFGKTLRNRIFCFLAIGLGLLLIAFFAFPMILEHKYTYGYLFTKDLFYSHFAPIQNFFIPNFFNSSPLRIEEVSVQFGIFHELALFLSAFFLLKRKLNVFTKRVLLYSVLLTIVTLFFMLLVSKPLWENISFLRQFQYPWRLLAIVCFTSSLASIGFFIFKPLKKKIVYVLLLFLVVASTIYYWYPPLGFKKIDEIEYWNYPLSTNYYGEVDLIWSAGPAKKYPDKKIEIIAGEAKISNFKGKSIEQTFFVEAKNETQLVSHTQFFPGWKVYVDDRSVPVEFQDQNWRGMITFAVPEGSHAVRISFEQSFLQRASNGLSTIILAMLVIGIPIAWKKKLL